jgi:hypothetical protein
MEVVSQYSDYVTGLTTEVQFPAGLRHFLLQLRALPFPGWLWDTPNLLSCVYQGLFPGDKGD